MDDTMHGIELDKEEFESEIKEFLAHPATIE
jgi:hypothetical protein